MHPEFVHFLAKERIAQIEQHAAASARIAEARAARSEPHAPAVAIRTCRVDDAEALDLLAALEGRGRPRGSFLVAEVAGAIVAAVPLDDDDAPLADPFRPTENVIALLELRAAQIRKAERRRLRLGLRRPASA